MHDYRHPQQAFLDAGAARGRALSSDANWRAYADTEVLRLTMPHALGGQGLGFGALCGFFEGLSYGGADPGRLFAVAAQLLSVQHPLVKFGTAAQQARWLPALMAGDLKAAHAATEPTTGSDVFALRATAIARDKGYVLNGHKCYCTSAPTADLALVLASTQPARKLWGISAFVVDLHTAGVRRSGNMPKMGLQSVDFGELVFEDCFVPDDHRLGGSGAGTAIFSYALDLERMFILAPVLGAMRRQIERTVQSANTRKRQGKSISAFQSVSNRIADMAMRLEMGRLATYQAAALRDAGQNVRGYSAFVKLALSELLLASSLDGFRLAGASGYLLDDPAEVAVRDALGSLFYSGTSDVLRTIIARAVGALDE